MPAFDGEQLGDRPSNTVTDDELAGLKGAERRARVKELVGRVPAKTTYQQWLEGQSASFQDEVLGRTRGRLFRRGEITLDKFVDNHGRQYTIAELRDRLPASALEAAGV